MKPRHTYFDRPVYIHICKDGTVTYRRKGQKVFNGVALPVFTVDNEEQAKQLQTRFCRLQYVEHPLMPGQSWYKLNEFSGELDDLERVADEFYAFYLEHLAIKGSHALVGRESRGVSRPRKRARKAAR